MTFRAPVKDLALALQTAGHPALVSAAFHELDEDTIAAVLEAAAAFTEEQLAPLNRVGDQVGARYENGKVTAAPGFADAYQAFVAGGWNSPEARFSPERMRRVAVAVSSLPDWNSMASRNAGR